MISRLSSLPGVPGTTPAPTPRPARRSRLAEIGQLTHFTGRVLVRCTRDPTSWLPEFVEQFNFAARVCFLPLVLMSFALSFGPVGIQASDFFGLFGALDRLGGIYQLTTTREFAPLVTGFIAAGAAGTAICADLGARVVREEVDALSVLGVDPIQSLVVPRVLALVAVTVLFDVVALLAGLSGALLVVVRAHTEPAAFFTTFFSNASTVELFASVLKSTLFGAVIALVCCHKGLTVSGGPDGVGRAVNQSVVIAFLAIGFIDYAFTQVLLATHPALSQTR